jgi:hypothetical protein
MRIIETKTKIISIQIFSKTEEKLTDLKSFIITSNPKAQNIELIHTKQSNVGWFYTLEIGML